MKAQFVMAFSEGSPSPPLPAKREEKQVGELFGSPARSQSGHMQPKKTKESNAVTA